MRRARITLAAAALSVLVAPVQHAQAPRYRAQSDTLVMTRRNPFHMYFVRGTDTLGNAVLSHDLTREVWRAKGDSIDVEVMRRDLDFGKKDTVIRYLVSPDGRALAREGHKPYGLPASLMPLPTVAIRPGLEWRDSSVITRDTNDFKVRFEWVMTYRVRRVLDTLGSKVADVVADGRYRMRDQWGDTARKREWVDVQGPDHETFLFDITRGRLAYRSWDMKLRGWGGGKLPGDSVASPDSVPAGLDSKTFDRLVPAEELGIVGFRQRGRDTSLTFTVPDLGLAGVHVIDRSADSIVSTHIRADGAVTLQRAVFAKGALVRFERAWSDTALHGYRETAAITGDSLIVARTGAPRRAFRAPARRIGVGDLGREELLVPLLMNLPDDSAGTSVAVFRPKFRKFDVAKVTRRHVDGGGWVLELAWDGAEESDVWLLTEDGDLLLIEKRSDEYTRRVPSQMRRVQLMSELSSRVKKGS
jgi:hypothetical protein